MLLFFLLLWLEGLDHLCCPSLLTRSRLQQRLWKLNWQSLDAEPKKSLAFGVLAFLQRLEPAVPIVTSVLPPYFLFCPHCHVPGSSGAKLIPPHANSLIELLDCCNRILHYSIQDWWVLCVLLLETRNRTRPMLLLFKLVCPSKYWLAKAVMELSYTFNHSSIWGFQMFVPTVIYFNLKTFSIQTCMPNRHGD